MNFFGPISTTDWRRPSVIALLLANLTPVLGLLFFHWDLFSILFLFWSENVIIGVLNALKMLLANPKSPLSWAGKLINVPFFCVHYGGFTLIHGFFVIALFGHGINIHASLQSAWFPFQLVRELCRIALENNLFWGVVSLAASRTFSFYRNYLANGEYKNAKVSDLMAQPYGRVIVMHLTLLGGGAFLLALDSPLAGLLMLVVLKTLLDLRGHFAEREKFATPPITD